MIRSEVGLMIRLFLVLISICFCGSTAVAQEIGAREGWAVHKTDKNFGDLVDATGLAIKANGMGIVTQAGPTGAAKARGIVIPGNRVIGAFNNIYAVRILKLSTAAMIEAPIRFYVTEEPDGKATLSYKTPGHVFGPYMDEGGKELALAAEELDAVFGAIADAAVK
jgi:uncharacterized protein (DUF302 family)